MAKKIFPYPEAEIGNSFSAGISTYVDWEPRANIIDAGELLIVEVELPGVNKDDVSIYLEGDNQLILRGTKRQPRVNANPDTQSKTTYYLFEREFGTFYKRIVIDFPLDSANIKSVMENGVLVVTLPRKKTEKISIEIN